MTLQQKLERLGTLLVNAVGTNVYHYWRPRLTPPYCIWAEDGEDTALDGDDHKAEQSVGGYIDYYTLTEYDPVLDTIQEALNSADFPLGWRLDSVQYEDDTNLIHYQWLWRL